MRAASVLLLFVLVAGCSGGSEPSSTTTSTPIPTTINVSTPPSDATTTTTTPVPPAAVNTTFYTADHDFSKGNPSMPTVETFDVPPGARNITLTVVFEEQTAVPVGATVNPPSVTIQQPDGASTLDCRSGGTEGRCARSYASPPAGAWSAKYANVGTITAHVRAFGYVSSPPP